jgi:sodium transport system ATP-binding protein
VSESTPPRYAVEVDSLVKEYRDPEGKTFRAVDALTFRARPGIVFGLLGPNGAGKTTALRMLSTLIQPTSGRALLHGYSVTTQPAEVRRHIGFLTGSTGLYPRLTAREVVRYFALMYGMPRDAVDARIESLFRELRIDFPNKRCGALSTGMMQRVSIARAIVHDPPILILDEPTTGLDVLASKDIVDFIMRSRDAGKCVIFSTHIMSEAERLCDDIAIIHRGRIVAAGTVDQLRRETGETKVEDVFLSVLARADAAAGAPVP